MREYKNQSAAEWWDTDDAPETLTRLCVERDHAATSDHEAFTYRSIHWCSSQEQVEHHKRYADRVLSEQTFKLN